MNLEKATLETIGNGVTKELFQREFDAVIRDIRDVNTDAKTKRKVVLEVELSPNEGREVSEVSIKCTSKLAGVRPAKAVIHIDQADTAFVNNIEQDTFDNVVDMGGKKDA